MLIKLSSIFYVLAILHGLSLNNDHGLAIGCVAGFGIFFNLLVIYRNEIRRSL